MMIPHGVLRGSEILRSCNRCHNSEYIRLGKFERPAGRKIKKTYSCIYFKNGKTINQVCQELSATPKDMLVHRLP